MDEDSLRENCIINLVCTKHPSVKLNFNIESTKGGASSAYDITLKLGVHPCYQCEHEKRSNGRIARVDFYQF